MKGVIVKELGRLRCNRRQWIIGEAPLRKLGNRGICAIPHKPCMPYLILASDHLPKRKPMRMEAFIHETLHALFPEAAETKIKSSARTLRKVLTVAGYKPENS